MSTALLCLLGFAAWTVALLLSVGGVRVLQILGGEKRSNEFPSGERHGGDRYWRLNRAHMNCVENLPIFAVIVLVGAVMGVSEPVIGPLACTILIARIGQSVTHIVSGSVAAVNLRFLFFLVQIVSFLWLGSVVVRPLL